MGAIRKAKNNPPPLQYKTVTIKLPGTVSRVPTFNELYTEADVIHAHRVMKRVKYIQRTAKRKPNSFPWGGRYNGPASGWKEIENPIPYRKSFEKLKHGRRPYF